MASRRPFSELRAKLSPAAQQQVARRHARLMRHEGAALLRTKKGIAAYLNAALEDDNPHVVIAALGNIAHAKGMAQLARKAGLGRESLHKALSPDGNPELSTVLKVVRALGLRLHATPAPAE